MTAFDPPQVDLPPYYPAAEVDRLFALQASQIAALTSRVLKLETGVGPPPPPPPPPPTGTWHVQSVVGAYVGASLPVHLVVTLVNDTDAPIAHPGVGIYNSAGQNIGWMADSSATVAPGGTIIFDSDTAPESADVTLPSGTNVLSAHPGHAAVDSLDGSMSFTVVVPLPPPDEPPPDPGATPPRFFAASSSWNTKLPTSGLNYAVVPSDQNGLPFNSGWINSDQYSSPIVISKSTDPVVTIDAPASWSWPAQRLQLRIPANITGSAGTDGNLSIVDGSTAYDFWQFRRTGVNSATVESWAKADIVNGSGWGDPDSKRGAGIRAAGCSHIAGELYGNELTTGIHHALGVAGGGYFTSYPPVGEAVSSDGVVPYGPLPEGCRLAIPRNVAAPGGLSVQGRTLWTAMQEYGAFVVDKAPGDQMALIFYADPLSVPSVDVDALLAPGWTAADLDAIVSATRRVL